MDSQTRNPHTNFTIGNLKDQLQLSWSFWKAILKLTIPLATGYQITN